MSTKITLTPKTGAFTALRAYVNGSPVINTMGGTGTWEGVAASVEVKAVGVAGSELDCTVKGDTLQHSATHILDSNGRLDVKLP
jgi:hypothetical protein